MQEMERRIICMEKTKKLTHMTEKGLRGVKKRIIDNLDFIAEEVMALESIESYFGTVKTRHSYQMSNGNMVILEMEFESNSDEYDEDISIKDFIYSVGTVKSAMISIKKGNDFVTFFQEPK